MYPKENISLRIRVSLGLQAEYEKDLFYSPYKRISSAPLLYATPDGVYVFEGVGRDHLRLYKHDGVYDKTIYPFPVSKIKKVNGLKWTKAPDGHEIPIKESDYHHTLLTSGTNVGKSVGDTAGDGKPNPIDGVAATGLAVKDNRIALAFEYLNRLAKDGDIGEMSLRGPKTLGTLVHIQNYGGSGGREQMIGPTSMAFSPDGKILYMTGYMWTYNQKGGSLPAVFKLNYETNEEMSLFAGKKKIEEYGSDDTHFAVPTSVETDAIGNIYVTDFVNNRVQIFEPSGKLLKSISVKNPAKVLVHQKTGEIYIFSWAVVGLPLELELKVKYEPEKIQQKTYIFTPYPETKIKLECEFPLGESNLNFNRVIGQTYQVTLDSWAKTPTI